VLLSFVDFDVETMEGCSKDNVTIIDNVTGKQLGTFCGQDPPSDVISSSNRLSVIFRTDSSETRLGFAIKYNARKYIPGRHT